MHLFPFQLFSAGRIPGAAVSRLLLSTGLVLSLSSLYAAEEEAPEMAEEVVEVAEEIVDEVAPAAEGSEIPLNTVPDTSTWPLEIRASYIMGYAMSRQVMQQAEQGGFNREVLLTGLSAGLTGQPPAVPQETWQAIMSQYEKQMTEKEGLEAAKNQAAAEQHLADLKEKEGVNFTESGIGYEVLTAAEGPKPTATSTVSVHYHGSLLNGSVFDSSVQRGEPVEFPLNRVIPGWTEGVQLMSVGSKYRFHIPANLAYGSQGRPGIPANSLLIFEVELLKILP